MKLNPDCIRDLMIELEMGLSVEAQNDAIYRFRPVEVRTLAIHMQEKFGYDRTDVVYSALQLWEGGYIETDGQPPAYGHLDMVEIGNVIYITPKGHQFLATIHSKETWSDKIRPILGKLGNVSLTIIEAVAKGVTDSVIENILASATQST